MSLTNPGPPNDSLIAPLYTAWLSNQMCVYVENHYENQ